MTTNTTNTAVRSDSSGLYDDPTQLDPLNAGSALLKGHQHFVDFLYKGDCPRLKGMFNELETKTGIKREQFVYAILALVPLYLLVGRHAALICNFITFAYPAVASLQAIKSTSDAKDEFIQWLVYWIVYGILAILDHMPIQLFAQIQFYWLLKLAGLIYLGLPEVKVAAKLYIYKVDPMLQKAQMKLSHKATTTAGTS